MMFVKKYQKTKNKGNRAVVVAQLAEVHSSNQVNSTYLHETFSAVNCI